MQRHQPLFLKISETFVINFFNEYELFQVRLPLPAIQREKSTLSKRVRLNRVGGWVVGGCFVGRGSWVLGSGSWVVGRGSWVVGRGSWVVGRGSWVVGRGSWVVGRGSWVVGRVCLKIKKYISSLSARSKFAIARSRINFPELLSFMKR